MPIIPRADGSSILTYFSTHQFYLKRFATITFSNSSSVLFFLAFINSRASLPTKYLCSGLAAVIARSITFATSFGDVPFAIVENRFSSTCSLIVSRMNLYPIPSLALQKQSLY